MLTKVSSTLPAPKPTTIEFDFKGVVTPVLILIGIVIWVNKKENIFNLVHQ